MNSNVIRPEWPAPANVVALTTLRTGGHSTGPYASLNLAEHVQDERAAVVANRAVLAEMLPSAADIQWLTQVHGARVIAAGSSPGCPEADASWTGVPNRVCAVLTADCLPVLFCSRRGDVVAAAHAGWRGLLAGVLENTVAAMGVAPGQLLAWLGPAIGPSVFEVGYEVRAAFVAAAHAQQLAQTEDCFKAIETKAGHYLADLYGLARLRLQALAPAGVFGGGFCTVCDPGRFYSYRRDGLTGRMASVILLDQGRT